MSRDIREIEQDIDSIEMSLTNFDPDMSYDFGDMLVRHALLHDELDAAKQESSE